MKKRLFAFMVGIGGPPHKVLRGLRFPAEEYEAMAAKFEETIDLSAAMADAPATFDSIWVHAVRLGQESSRVDCAMRDLVRYDRVVSDLPRTISVARLVAGVWVLNRAGCTLSDAVAICGRDLGHDPEALAAAKKAVAEHGLGAALRMLADDDPVLLNALDAMCAPLDAERGVTELLGFLMDEFERRPHEPLV
jgi:hypothetical protein